MNEKSNYRISVYMFEWVLLISSLAGLVSIIVKLVNNGEHYFASIIMLVFTLGLGYGAVALLSTVEGMRKDETTKMIETGRVLHNGKLYKISEIKRPQKVSHSHKTKS